MVSRAFNKDIVRAITGSLGRFVAVFAIVALGVGFYAGLRMTAPDMGLAADAFYDSTNLMDIRVASTMGLDREDVEAIRDLDGVESVIAAYETDVVADISGEPYTVRVHSLPGTEPNTTSQGKANDFDGLFEENINQLTLEEGRMPSSEGECVMSADRIMNSPLSVGDRITITEMDDSDPLKATDYLVVGLVHASYYTSQTSMGSSTRGSGVVEQFMYVPRTDFSSDYPITEAFIAVKGTQPLLNGSFDYQSKVDEVVKELAGLALEHEESRLETIKADASKDLDEARQELEDAKAESQQKLDEAKASLDAAAAEIDASRAKLEQGLREYDSGISSLASERSSAERKMAEAQVQIDSSQRQLNEARSTLDANAAQLQAAWVSAGMTPEAASTVLAQLKQQYENLPSDTPDETRAHLRQQIATLESLISMQEIYDGKEAEYDKGIAKLEASKAELAAQRQSAQAQFEAAEQKLASAKRELDNGQAQLASGEEQYASGVAEYDAEKARADSEIADAEAKIRDSEAEIASIEKPEWLIMDRTKNFGAESFSQDAERVDSIAQVFPLIFFLVAALVALTTMTRMVEEDRMVIGTYKALGYSKRRIASKYLIYALAASLGGSIVGIAALSFTLPAVIMGAYSIVYIVPTSGLAIDWGIALTSAALGIGITILATWGAVWSTLRETPAALMLPRAPKAGKRILLERVKPVWAHLSFLWKVTCRNLFRYKKRMLMTVIGIAGCTALMLTGFGLYDSINDIIDKEFGEIESYNMTIERNDGATSDESAAVTQFLEESDDVGMLAEIRSRNVSVSGGNKDIRVSIVVPDSVDDFTQLHRLRDRESGQTLPLVSDGAIVSEKLASRSGAKPGGFIEVSEQDSMGNPTGEAIRIPVSAISEQYVNNDIYMTEDVYASVFGETMEQNQILVESTAEGAERQSLSQALQALPGVKTVSFSDETIDSYRTALKSVNTIVYVLIIAAALLAFIVLYNLTNINITERMREIATLKVLGFTRGEVQKYIFREMAILTLLGALLGLVFGVFLENFVVVTAEVDAVMFGREIHGTSFVLAFVCTMAFALIVALFMRGKLDKVDMVESLKSNE